MALIAMAVYCTEENGKDEYLAKTLLGLNMTVDFSKHRLVLVVNGGTERTFEILQQNNAIISLAIQNDENVGTAAAINKAWGYRKPGEHLIKMDDDIVIHDRGWIEEMEAAIAREPMIGQVGLKRKDCWEYPEHHNPDYKSKLIMLPHQHGEDWIIVEQSKHIIGSCVMHNAALIEKVGGMWQPTLYGHDDVLMSWRSHLAGFINVFLPHINIDHIDPGGTQYQAWKEKEGGKNGKMVSDIVDEYISGERSIVYPL